jgi:hypothetical protein
VHRLRATLGIHQATLPVSTMFTKPYGGRVLHFVGIRLVWRGEVATPLWSVDEKVIMKPLSESLSELSVKAKGAEDAAAAAREESRDKLEARLVDLRSSAEQRRAHLEQAAIEAKESAASRWDELRSSVNAHLERIKTDFDARRQTLDVKRAQRRAESAEQDAAATILFAAFAIEQAEYAVLDATLARSEADAATQT